MARGGARDGAGRPRIVETPEEFEERTFAYVDERIKNKLPITLVGLCLYMGFKTKQSLYDYEKRAEFADSVAYARLLVEDEYEKRLHDKNCVGAIFWLKNHGWHDQQTLNFKNLAEASDEELEAIAAGKIP